MLNVLQKQNKKETITEFQDIDNIPELQTKLAQGFLGQTFRYTGETSGDYVNGDLYKVEEKPLYDYEQEANILKLWNAPYTQTGSEVEII